MNPTDERTTSAELQLLAPVQGGQMLARRSGQVVFIHGGMPGEVVVSGDLEKRRGYMEGDAEAVLQQAPARVHPPCPYFGENTKWRGSVTAERHLPGLVCGGCQYQHVAYEAQLEIKTQVVREQLRRVGKIVDAPVLPIVPSPRPFAYRNKASWIVTPEGHLAYHEARSHRPVTIDECHLLMPSLGSIFDRLRANMPSFGPANLVHAVEARSLPIGGSEEAGSLVVTFDPETTSSEAHTVAEALRVACPTIAGVVGVAQYGETAPVVLSGNERLRAEFLGRPIYVAPTTFFQVNSLVAEAIVEYVLAQIGAPSGRMIVDAYCGAGTFTVPLATQADAVVGIEVDAGAIADIRATLETMALDNVTLLEGDAGQHLRSLLPGTAHAVIVDPPRSGCSQSVLRQLARIKAPRVVYISCDPSTLARDLRFLIDQGYLLESVQPYDMFPQTAHIESVSSLRLPKKFQAKG